MGDFVESRLAGSRVFVAALVTVGCLFFGATTGASAATAAPSAVQITGKAVPSETSLRKKVKCRMAGGFIRINLKKMRCKPAIKMMSKWVRKFYKKPGE